LSFYHEPACRTAGFPPGCIADFQIGSRTITNGPQVSKPALQQTKSLRYGPWLHGDFAIVTSPYARFGIISNGPLKIFFELISRSAHSRCVNHLAKAREVFDIEIAALKKVRAQLNPSFARAVEAIVEAIKRRGKIVLVGIGKSGNVGRKIAATLTSTGATSVVLDSVDALHGDVGIVNDGDVILALSYSGESDELLNLLPALKRFSVKFISLTGNTKSSLARHSDVVLNVKVPREACPFNLAPTSSTTAMLVTGDALAMAVLDARGFKQKDFALNHPAGAIGRAMLLKVGDIMRKGDRNAIAHHDILVKEALLLMTRARSGSLSVVDARGRLSGVFTDGDLRRHMAADEDLLSLLSKPLKAVMTRNPICILEGALASEALKMFDERNIDDLIVVNSKKEPVGLVDSQDLPKLKIM
jgi:arabinose-5-phosphate isomerase